MEAVSIFEIRDSPSPILRRLFPAGVELADGPGVSLSPCGSTLKNAVPSNAARLVARLLWIVPALLLFLTINQAKVAHDVRQTWRTGTPATAEVLAYENADRVDVTYGYVNLRVTLADGTTLTKENLSLPSTILPRLEGAETLAVRVRPGAAQEIVIDQLMPAHWLIAAAQAGMAFLAALIFGGGVLWWNRLLRRQAAMASAEKDVATPTDG